MEQFVQFLHSFTKQTNKQKSSLSDFDTDLIP